MLAQKNVIRIETNSLDIEKVKTHSRLIKTEKTFKVTENVKYVPRMIVYGIPAKMTKDEIREELIAQRN